MKKLSTAIALLAISSPRFVAAATNPFVGAGANLGQVTGVAGPGGKTSVPLILGYLMQAIFGTLGIIALVYVIYAGYIRLIATEPDDVKKSNRTLIYLGIGIVILLSAFEITNFFFNQFFNPLTGSPIQ